MTRDALWAGTRKDWTVRLPRKNEPLLLQVDEVHALRRAVQGGRRGDESQALPHSLVAVEHGVSLERQLPLQPRQRDDALGHHGQLAQVDEDRLSAVRWRLSAQHRPAAKHALLQLLEHSRRQQRVVCQHALT